MDLLQENQIHIIIERTPYNQATYEVLSDDTKNTVTNFYDEIESLYPEAVVNNNIFCYENAYFGDSSHVNDMGARRYCQYILDTYPDVFEKHVDVLE